MMTVLPHLLQVQGIESQKVRECSDVLYLNMVLQLQYAEQKIPAENSESSREGHQSFPPFCP